MEIGNNIESLQIINIKIPFYNDESLTANPGTKYYFPENPHIDKKTVVGIELHATTSGFGNGDIRTQPIGLGYFSPTAYSLRNILFTFSNENKEIVFENVPGVLLFGVITSLTSPKQKIMPFLGKIATRNCYVQIPANSTFSYINTVLSLTFYLR